MSASLDVVRRGSVEARGHSTGIMLAQYLSTLSARDLKAGFVPGMPEGVRRQTAKITFGHIAQSLELTVAKVGSKLAENQANLHRITNLTEILLIYLLIGTNGNA